MGSIVLSQNSPVTKIAKLSSNYENDDQMDLAPYDPPDDAEDDTALFAPDGGFMPPAGRLWAESRLKPAYRHPYQRLARPYLAGKDRGPEKPDGGIRGLCRLAGRTARGG